MGGLPGLPLLQPPSPDGGSTLHVPKSRTQRSVSLAEGDTLRLKWDLRDRGSLAFIHAPPALPKQTLLLLTSTLDIPTGKLTLHDHNLLVL